MAAKKRRGKKKRRLGLKIALALLVCLALGVFSLYAASRVVHVRYATVYLRDLPAAFEGTTVLFVSDLDIHSAFDAHAAAGMMRSLAPLQPDILLLGGDYTSPGLWETINGMQPDDAMVSASAVSNRHLFFSALADFEAPLGKFAVAAADDVFADQLAQSMQVGGVRLLDGEAVTLSRDGQTLVIAGLSPEGDASQIASTVRESDCVVAFTHTPDRFANALISEADGGGVWADMILAGGTHGGQMRIGDSTLLSLTERERSYLSGWRKEGGVFLLTSQGVGCEVADLRLNTAAEVHFITLRRAVQPLEEDTNGIFMQ